MPKDNKTTKVNITFAQERFTGAVPGANKAKHSSIVAGSVTAKAPVPARKPVGPARYAGENVAAGAGQKKESLLDSLSLAPAILAGKITLWLVRFLGFGRGSSLPGVVASKICPSILGRLAKRTYRGVVMVTGTNGKTTTCNMIARVFGEAGYRPLINAEGANLIAGLTAAFIKAASLLGRVDRDYVFLEVDEASFSAATQQLTPDLVVVTNFSRDQLDRHGELDEIVSRVRKALSKLPDTRLVLNADDPLVAHLAITTGLKATFYGLGAHSQVTLTQSPAQEKHFCPVCNRKLDYGYHQYGQLGSYRCSGCGFSRPFAAVEGSEATVAGGAAKCCLSLPGVTCPLVIQVPGLYGLYNGLAALTVCMLLGLEPNLIIRALEGHVPLPGRMERFSYQGKTVLLNLVKNPASFNEGLNILQDLPGPVDILIAINDGSADGRDISWLWDVDFEVLQQHCRQISLLICTGRRKEEIAVRLKYAGAPVDKIVVQDIPEAVKSVLCGSGKVVCVLTNYTALWPLERTLDKYAERESFVKGVPPVS